MAAGTGLGGSANPPGLASPTPISVILQATPRASAFACLAIPTFVRIAKNCEFASIMINVQSVYGVFAADHANAAGDLNVTHDGRVNVDFVAVVEGHGNV